MGVEVEEVEMEEVGVNEMVVEEAGVEVENGGRSRGSIAAEEVGAGGLVCIFNYSQVWFMWHENIYVN